MEATKITELRRKSAELDQQAKELARQALEYETQQSKPRATTQAQEILDRLAEVQLTLKAIDYNAQLSEIANKIDSVGDDVLKVRTFLTNKLDGASPEILADAAPAKVPEAEMGIESEDIVPPRRSSSFSAFNDMGIIWKAAIGIFFFLFLVTLFWVLHL